jgi:hypothetical protein
MTDRYLIMLMVVDPLYMIEKEGYPSEFSISFEEYVISNLLKPI